MLHALSLILFLQCLPATSSATALSLPLYGIFPWRTLSFTQHQTLQAVLPTLTQALGIPVVLPEGGVESGCVTPPEVSTINLASDDRISVPSRAALVSKSRRSHADLGDAHTVSLSLGHVTAWERFLVSGAPYALFVVDPGNVVVAPGGGSGGGSLEGLHLGEGGVGGPGKLAWDLALLGSLVPPTLSSAGGGDLDWAYKPLKWRGWYAYILSAKGVKTLLDEGALPLSQRLESHAGSLVDLGLLSAVAWRGRRGGLLARSAAATSAAAAAATAITATVGGDPPPFLAEVPCDLCDIPENYSRATHIAFGVLPTAVIAGLLTAYAQHLVCGGGGGVGGGGIGGGSGIGITSGGVCGGVVGI